jgi:universal stress protein A
MMSIYTNILLAVDLRVTHDVYTIERAVKFAKSSKATLYIIHVMEPIHGYGTVKATTILEIEKDMREQAKQAFDDLVSQYDLSSDQLILETGSPKLVIVEQAKRLNVDLIIVGAHSESKINLLLGSTANGVINQAHCDVLAIRTPA